MTSSPARKRTKFNSHDDPPERWSLNNNDLLLTDMADFGVGRLTNDEHDEDEIEVTKHVSQKQVEKEIALLESTLPKETLQKLQLGQWDGFHLKTNVESTTNYFDNLSDEVILHVFYWLPKRHLPNLSLVCQRWHRLAQDESLWSRMDISNRHLEPGALGHILSRQVVILRMAQSEISYPPILSGVRACASDFSSRLLYLDLSMAHIDRESLTVIFLKCQRIKKLSLERVTVDDDALLALSRNTELEVLNLAMAEGFGVEGLSYIFTNCQKLKELNIAWTYLDRDSIDFMCSHLPATLDRFNISGCRKLLLDDNVLDIVSNCPNLRELDLSDCTGLTARSIQHITTLEELNFLAVSRCYQIPFGSFTLLKKIASLVYLDIHGGYISSRELKVIQDGLGSRVHLNKFKFSSVARPTVGPRRSSIWGLRVRD